MSIFSKNAPDTDFDGGWPDIWQIQKPAILCTAQCLDFL
jgi:hypothetical protein